MHFISSEDYEEGFFGSYDFLEAVLKNKTKVINAYLNDNAQYTERLNVRDHLGRTAIFIATSNKKEKILDSLLLAHADPNIPKYKNEITPLLRACAEGYTKGVKRLIEGSADINQSSSLKHSPCHITLINGDHYYILDLLITAGAKLNGQDCRGFTPLGLAMVYGRVKCVERLLAKDLKPLEADKDLFILNYNYAAEAFRTSEVSTELKAFFPNQNARDILYCYEKIKKMIEKTIYDTFYYEKLPYLPESKRYEAAFAFARKQRATDDGAAFFRMAEYLRKQKPINLNWLIPCYMGIGKDTPFSHEIVSHLNQLHELCLGTHTTFSKQHLFILTSALATFREDEINSSWEEESQARLGELLGYPINELPLQKNTATIGISDILNVMSLTLENKEKSVFLEKKLLELKLKKESLSNKLGKRVAELESSLNQAKRNNESLPIENYHISTP